MNSAIQSWAQSDPAAAAARAAGLSDADQRTAAFRTIAGAWGPRDERAALSWAESLDGKDRSAALGALVQNSLQSNPDQAQQLFQKFSSSLDADAAVSSETRGVARNLASTLTENNPQQALAWAQTLAAGPLRDEAVAGIAQKWASYDAVATSEWLGTLPAGEGRDLAAANLVSTIARDDPESAWVWATSIDDAAKRREAAARTLEAWKAYGQRDAARAALQAAGFTADEMKELSRKLD